MFHAKSLNDQMTFLNATMGILQVAKITSGFVKKWFTKPFWIKCNILRHPWKLMGKWVYLHAGLISAVWERGSKNGVMSLRMPWKPTTVGKIVRKVCLNWWVRFKPWQPSNIHHVGMFLPWISIQGKNRRENFYGHKSKYRLGCTCLKGARKHDAVA